MGLTLNGRKVLDRTLLRGQEFILDADEDSSLTADTDDQLDLRLGGTDIFVFKTTGLDIGAVTNAILVSGTTTSAFKIDADATTGLEITSNCTPTDGIIIAGSTARGINISGAASSAQLYIGGTDILANGEQAIYVNCPSEDGATNAAWFTLGSTVTSGDVTGLRSRVTGNAASGGANIRGAYTEAFCGASKHVATLQGMLAHASVAAGTCTVATTQVICGIFGTGDSFTGTDVYVGYLKAQTRGTETIGGDYCLLGLENEAVGGVGKQMDSAIRIFATNVSTPYAFDYGIDLSGAAGEIASADILLSNSETISNMINGKVGIGSGGTDTLTVDTANERVGIGATEPQTALHIATNVGSGVKLERGTLDARWWGASGGPAYFGTISNDVLKFQTNNVDRMTIASGGGYGAVDVINLLTAGNLKIDGATGDESVFNDDSLDCDFRIESNGNSAMFFVDGGNNRVGIGTAAPQSLLDVQGAAGAAGILTLATKELTVVDGDVLGRINFNAPLESDGGDAILVGAAIWAEADATFSSTVNSTELVFATGTSGAAVERMRIDRDGNVGIGTTGPTNKLHIYGTDGEFGITIENTDTVGTHSVFNALITDQGASYWGQAGTPGRIISTSGAGDLVFNNRTGADIVFSADVGYAQSHLVIKETGEVGISTTAPSRILDCNDGSGNMIADGYDNHPSYLANKVDPKPMSNVLTKFKQVIPYEYKRIPYVSAEELAKAGIKEFKQERWEAAFPDGYRGGKLKHCPDEEIKAFLDNLGDKLRTERQEWPKYQRLHYSLALDDLADTFPDILSRNKDGDVTGYSLNNYVGLLHACITGLIERVEQLETKKGQ